MTRVISSLVFSLFALLLIFGCGANKEITKEIIPTDSPQTVNQYEIISEPLEEARLFYVAALQKQALNSVSEAIKNYENALGIINGLGNYPGIEDNEAFSELAASVKEDYKKYIESLPEIPEDVSFAAREAWLKKTLVELNLKQDIKDLLDRKQTFDAEIPLEINGVVENWIQYYTTKGKKEFTDWLARSGKYFPMMRRILKEEGVPEQLVYMTLVASGLDPVSKSWSGGEGLWSIQKSASSLFGLQTTYYLDERRDPEKSTRVAAKYLKSLRGNFSDWYLAIAAFNTGEGRVNRIIKKNGNTGFWALMPNLPKEAQNYVPQFIAVSYIGMNLQRYGLENIPFQTPVDFEKVSINEAIDLGYIALAAKLSVDDLRALNPELIQSCTPVTSGEPYLLKVPLASSQLIASSLVNVPNNAKRNFAYHTVKRGETIKSVAEKYGVSAADLADVNEVSSRAKLKSGLRLKIPFSSNYQVSDYATVSNEVLAESTTTANGNAMVTIEPRQEDLTENAESQNSSGQAKDEEFDPSIYDVSSLVPSNRARINYTVKQGESILDIASLFTVRVSDLRNWNNISYTKTIKVGQVLSVFVPEDMKEYYSSLDNLSHSEKKTVAAAEPVVNKKITRYHTVRRGESLRSIALKYNVSTSDVAKWNDLRRNQVHRNQRLLIYQLRNTDFTEAERGERRTVKSSVFHHKVHRGETLSDIASEYGVSVSAIKKLNHLKSNKLVAGTRLKIRTTERTSFYGDNSSRTSGTLTYHKVKKGETLAKIASRYGVSEKSVRKWNGITGSSKIAGKKLKIYSDVAANTNSVAKRKATPPVVAVKPVLPKGVASTPGKRSVNHTVQKGESLFTIAKKYKTSIQALKDNNNLNSDKLKPGQSLKVK